MVSAPNKSNGDIDVCFHTVASLIVLFLLAVAAPVRAAATDKTAKLIAPAVSTGTGLLLEPALTLPEFTREKFEAAMATVGPEKIHKPWTNAVVTLPPHPRADVKGLTEDEVKAYMMEAKRLFTEGKAVPTSEVGLISTQEDVIRQPMLNHIAAFSNSVVRPTCSCSERRRARVGPISRSCRT